MINKLDLSVFNNTKKVKIGELTKEVITALGLNRSPCDIVIWKDRVKYTQKHKGDFLNDQEYYKHLQSIPDIIKNPDYVGLHPSTNSIQYIKRINEIMLVGIRLKNQGELNFRSSYPISEENLNRYIDSGTIIDYKNIVNNIDNDK